MVFDTELFCFFIPFILMFIIMGIFYIIWYKKENRKWKEKENE